MESANGPMGINCVIESTSSTRKVCTGNSLGKVDNFCRSSPFRNSSEEPGKDINGDMISIRMITTDAELPRVLGLGFDVVVVTGDHSTPSVLGSHSWHPVPFLLHSKWCLGGRTSTFTESAAAAGVEGRIPARCLIPLALAHARRLEKYGA